MKSARLKGGGFNLQYGNKCEQHFDQWYQKPDLERCKLERNFACRTGLETCDLWKYHPYYEQLTIALQQAHNLKNFPRDFAHCDQLARGGFKIYDIGSIAADIPEYAQKLANLFANTGSNAFSWLDFVGGSLGEQAAKSLARCSCNAVRWKSNIENHVYSGSDFVKYGNNGTVSCNEFCVGSQWGDDQVGTCASAVLEGSPVSCSHVPGFLEGPELTCNCYQNATVRYGNNGTVNCNEFCGRTNETCLAAYDTLHNRALSCEAIPGYLDGKHLKCSCMP